MQPMKILFGTLGYALITFPLAYVWHLDDPPNTVCYALTFAEAATIAGAMKWTSTKSWKQGGSGYRPGYGTRRPTTKLLELLRPHRMTPRAWRKKVLEAA